MKELTCCLYCQGDLLIKEVEFQSCTTRVKGEFKTNRFHMFAPDELFFIEVFLKNQGNIKLVEKERQISYPTVKSRLKSIIKTLGYQVEDVKENQRVTILNDLSAGRLNVKEAIKGVTCLK